MNTRTLSLDVPDGPMPLYEAVPDGPARGAVIVVQEAFGVNDHIEDVIRRFASAGYHAVAPHLFHRSGSPVLSYDDIPAVIPHLMALADEVSKLSAVCMVCGAPAIHTQRLGQSQELVVVGAAGLYEARCRACFQPFADEHGSEQLELLKT